MLFSSRPSTERPMRPTDAMERQPREPVLLAGRQSAMSRRLPAGLSLVLVLALVLSACGLASTGAGPAGTTEPSRHPTVADYFSPPQAYPGPTWTQDIHIALPPDARATGYRKGELELWLSASEPDAAYLRVDDDVERWPRANPVVACA
jgi:hypothetical protein